MTFKYRLKYYKNEDGEYTTPAICDEQTIKDIISKHWMGDNIPNSLEVISITNEIGQSLLLAHTTKDVFEVFYLPLYQYFHYHKKSWISVIFDSLDLFMNNKIAELESSLNKTSHEHDYIRGDFFFKDHNYQITKKRNWNELKGVLFILPIGIIMISFGIFGIFYFKNLFIGLVFLLFIFLGGWYWLPGLILHIQYYNDNKNFQVRITTGDEIIKIETPWTKREISKSDINKISKFGVLNYKNPWGHYGYTEIEFKSGEILNLTNLMIDQMSILDKFKYDQVNILTVWRIPFLKRRTKII